MTADPVIVRVVTPDQITAHNDTLQAWVKANGIEPRRVAVKPITIEQDGEQQLIRYHQLRTMADGRHVRDPHNADEVWTVERTAPLTTPLVGVPEGQPWPASASTPDRRTPDLLRLARVLAALHEGETIGDGPGLPDARSRRVVLVKPGDVLLIGNVGQLDQDAVDALHDGASQFRSALGLAQVALFEGDIDLAVTTPSSTEADA
ncbi:hypothetical protein [Streptomyces sp. NBC_00847]|uniref:hypothetical protein n=1 Tax=Streptomyces sp. NBC_00847 TaxID=2975850 RepID=UPI00225E69CB|nr:hypothetical protein [Streptomyces sp. NBC_00847]MCX4886054.1 hypothetical protein [Streptomyces sp. NBC_00847]